MKDSPIFFIVDQFISTTPDEVIALDIRRRGRRAKIPSATVESWVRIALQRHHENQRTYKLVTRGTRRNPARKTKSNPGGLRGYGPGKFDTMLDSFLYTLDPDDEIGDSQELGWFGIYRGLEVHEVAAAAGLDKEKLTSAEREFIEGSVGAIAGEDNQGFVSVDYFEDEEEMESRWDEIEAEYEEFYGEAME